MLPFFGRISVYICLRFTKIDFIWVAPEGAAFFAFCRDLAGETLSFADEKNTKTYGKQ